MRAALAALVLVALGLSFEFGVLRSFVAVGMFAAILLVGSRFLQHVMAAPPDPEITDVADYDLKYVCTMCGLELKVEKAARDKAPTHCMEPMELIREGGRPPLRPVTGPE